MEYGLSIIKVLQHPFAEILTAQAPPAPENLQRGFVGLLQPRAFISRSNCCRASGVSCWIPCSPSSRATRIHAGRCSGAICGQAAPGIGRQALLGLEPLGQPNGSESCFYSSAPGSAEISKSRPPSGPRLLCQGAVSLPIPSITPERNDPELASVQSHSG